MSREHNVVTVMDKNRAAWNARAIKGVHSNGKISGSHLLVIGNFFLGEGVTNGRFQEYYTLY